ncbi:hypothetical protein G9A89_008795 [Geosiphon pyriformis]|nr:hypothetical protein G9A89_008795 [Geosiphon pyriformis]
MPVFVVIELVGFFANSFDSSLTSLETCSNTKKKHVKSVYFHIALYKKPKKPDANDVLVDLSIGFLVLEDIDIFSNKPTVFWRSEVGSVASSMSGFLDVENIMNTVAKKTSYAKSDENNNMNDVTLRKTHIQTYVLNNPPKALMFDIMSDNENLLSIKLCVLEKCSFKPVKLFALDVELSAELAICEKILVNNNLKKVNSQLNRKVIIKEISVDFPKLAVKSVFSKFSKVVLIKMQLIGLWQKALMKFESSKIFVFLRKNSVCVAKAVDDKQIWVSRDYYRALLYTLPISTTAHDLFELLVSYSKKTCTIDYNLVTYVHDRYVVVCFDFEKLKDTAIGFLPIFKSMNLHWAGLSLACYTKCKQFGHISDVCLTGENSGGYNKWVVTSQDHVHLANIYKKKQAFIARSVSFGDKIWAQIAGGFSACVILSDFFGVGMSSSTKPISIVFNSLSNSCLIDCLASLECSLELLLACLASNLNSDMTLNNTLTSSTSPLLVVIDIVANFSSSSFKVLTTKVELSVFCFGFVGFSYSLMNNFVWKIAMCNKDIIHWHRDSENLVSIVTETKLRSSLAIIMNAFLACHVCKVSKVPDQLLSINLLFKNKLFVSILELYAGAFLAVHFFQAGNINSLIAKTVNELFFVILGGNFNENGSCKCVSFKKCLNLGLSSEKTINYTFVSSNLVNVVVNHSIIDVSKHFNTNYQAIFVSIDLSGFLDVLVIQNETILAANTAMLSNKFVVSVKFADLGAMWNVVHKTMTLSVNEIFRKIWSKSSRFHKLELLVFKLVKAFCLASNRLDTASALAVKFLFFLGSNFNTIHLALVKTRKFYCSSKMLKSKHAKKSCIKTAVNKKIENFELDKGYIIRSVLEHLFHKIVLNHLVVDDELVLEPDLPLDYVFDGVFSDIMCLIGFDEMFAVVLNLPDGKAASLSGISNELWKHCDKIFLACSTFDVFYENNFSVLKGTMTQSSIFAVGSVIKDALEKN